MFLAPFACPAELGTFSYLALNLMDLKFSLGLEIIALSALSVALTGVTFST
jgi:hypothetical protein